ncbi:MAG: hypothetical protein NT105_17715 [Verrucomicrobia bacterium]|nr:hypothetical protein [Verrucomicrobiota bacterium]
MNLLCRPLVLFLLLALTGLDAMAQADCDAAVTVWKAKERTDFPHSVNGHSEWKPVTIELHSTMQSGTVRVEGKKSLWELKTSFPPGLVKGVPWHISRIPVVGFIAPGGGIWVGPEKDFYIESSAGVVGAQYRGGICWFESLVYKRSQAKTTLDDCLKLFERQIDGTTLDLFSGEQAVTPEGIPTRCARTHITSLSPHLDSEILLNMPWAPDAPPGDVHLTGVQVTGNTLRLDLRSRRDGLFIVKGAMQTKESLSSTGIVVQIRAANRPSEILTMKVPSSSGRTRGQYVASVWIDIPSKTVTKAEENGRFMWP